MIRYLSLLFVILISQFALAQTRIGSLLINADQMDRDFQNRVTTVSGNVQIIYEEQHFSCDKALIYEKDNRLVADGHVVITSSNQTIEADKIDYDFKNNTGIFTNAFIQSGQVLFEGATIEKLGANEYVATDAKYTACETCPAGWSFSGKNIVAHLGGYADIKYPLLRIGDVPILLLPRILVPLKSDRQSGLLVPRWGGSKRGGFEISQSYFWAISRSQDATYTLKHYEELGTKSLINYRYVLSPTSKGVFDSGFIRDREFEKNQNDTSPATRWFTRYNHFYDLPDGFAQRADINLVSDLRYPQDFSKEIGGYGDSALENRFSITKTWDDQLFVTSADYYVNLLKDDPLAGNANSVHRFPEIRYSIRESKIGESGFLFHADSHYINFAREGFGFDDAFDESLCSCLPGTMQTDCAAKGGHAIHEKLFSSDQLDTWETATSNVCVDPIREALLPDGVFNGDRDIIRAGQRLIVKPSLSYPMMAGPVSIVPSVTYNESYYRFSVHPDDPDYTQSLSRRAIETDLSLKTMMSHVYGNPEDKNDILYKHIIEPTLTYTSVPWVQQPRHRFFADIDQVSTDQAESDLSESDLTAENGLQFDYYDRLFKKQSVDFALNNRVVRKKWVHGNPIYTTIAAIKISQGYDLQEARDPNGFPWKSLKGIFDLRFDSFETYTDLERFGYANVTNTKSRVKVYLTDTSYTQLSYTHLENVDDNLPVEGSLAENYSLTLGFAQNYFDVNGTLDYSVLTDRILSWNILAVLKPPGNCWSIALEAEEKATGAFQYELNFSFNFGGERGVL